MQIKKEELAKRLEEISKVFSEDYREVVEEISNAIMFLSLYCGNNLARVENVNLKIKNSSYQITKNEKYDEQGQKVFIKSYDDTQSLEIIFAKTYLKIERKKDNDFDYYLAEYIFKKDHFIRKAIQKSTPIDRDLILEESSEGEKGKGIYYSEIREKNENMNLVFIKIPDKNKIENVYYSYHTDSEIKLFYKVPSEYKKIPYVNSFGITNLTNFLSRQAEDEYIKFDNEQLFNDLVRKVKKNY